MALLPLVERLYDTSDYLPLGIGTGLCAVCSMLLLVRRPLVGLTRTDVAACLCLLYLMVRAAFCGTTSLASCFLFLYAALLYVTARLADGAQRCTLLYGLVLGGLLQAFIAWLQYMGLVPSMHSLFACTGTFLNPAPLGGWLSMGMIAAFGLWKEGKAFFRRTRTMLVLALLLMGSALVLADSRASWVACGSVLLLMSMKKWFSACRYRWAILVSVVLMAILPLYLYRRSSADSRLFIWKVCAEMVQDAPLFGQGPQGVKRCYMHFQADYLENQGTAYERLQATDNSLAFNEGIRILCEYGFVGCLLMLLSLLLAWMESRRGIPFRYLLSGFLVFACFSYPSDVFSLLSVFFLMLGCLPSLPIRNLHIKRQLAVCLFSVPLLFGLVYVYASFRANRALDHFYWDEEAEAEWQRCYPLFQNEREPVSRYAHTLVLGGEYASAIAPLEQLIKLSPTVEIYNDLGYCYQMVGEVMKAESCYRYASSMAPGRILPHYRLFRLYRSQKDWKRMREEGGYILTMDVKIENEKVKRIREEVEVALRKKRVCRNKISLPKCHSEHREESVDIYFVFTDPSLRSG